MKCSIFIKSHSADYPWLIYCLRSIVRFCTGFESTVVVTDDGQPKPPIGPVEKWFTVKPKQPGYLHQQSLKLSADAFTDSQYVLYGDSDTIFTRLISPEDVTIAGLPVWLYEPYAGMTNPDVLARQKTMSDFIGAPVQFEFMRRHPFIITRNLLADFRRFCLCRHGMTVEDYVMQAPNMSEFNLIACWAYEHRRTEIAWRRPDEMPVFVRQWWSHGGLTDEIRQEAEGLLK